MSCTKHKILKVEDEIILSRVMLAASCLQEDTPDNVRRLVKIEAIRRKSTGDLSHTSFRTIIISSVKACKNQVMTHWRTKSRNCSEIATKEMTTETPEWGTPFFLFLSNGLLFSFQSFKGLGDKARTRKITERLGRSADAESSAPSCPRRCQKDVRKHINTIYCIHVDTK